MLLVLVTAASVQDRDGARRLLARLGSMLRRLHLIFADSAYAGDLEDWLWCDVRQWRKIWLHIVRKPAGQKGFCVQAKRWIVERTFAWLSRWRRLSKDYEGRPETSECLIRIAMIALMTRRLADLQPPLMTVENPF